MEKYKELPFGKVSVLLYDKCKDVLKHNLTKRKLEYIEKCIDAYLKKYKVHYRTLSYASTICYLKEHEYEN